VLQYVLEGNSKLTIRPSGTEPKLKFYFAVKDKDQAAAEKKLAEFKEKVIAQMDEIMDNV